MTYLSRNGVPDITKPKVVPHFKLDLRSSSFSPLLVAVALLSPPVLFSFFTFLLIHRLNPIQVTQGGAFTL